MDVTKTQETKKISGWLFGQILKLIHPIMPFLTENIWQNLLSDEIRNSIENKFSLEMKELDYI